MMLADDTTTDPVKDAQNVKTEVAALVARAAKSDVVSDLLHRYISAHGEWRQISASGEGGSTQFFEFIPCECALCKEALALVGSPPIPA